MSFQDIQNFIGKMINPSAASGEMISPLAKSTPTPTPYQGKSGMPNHPVFNGALGTHAQAKAPTQAPTTFNQILGKPAVASAQTAPNQQLVVDLINKIFPEDPKTARAIFTHESQLGKFFQNLSGSNAYGVAQIMLPSHRDKIPGATDEQKIEYLRSPENNLKIARQIYDKQGWSPWQSYTTGKYKQYLQ